MLMNHDKKDDKTLFERYINSLSSDEKTELFDLFCRFPALCTRFQEQLEKKYRALNERSLDLAANIVRHEKKDLQNLLAGIEQTINYDQVKNIMHTV